MVRHKVSYEVYQVMIKLLKEGKTVPLIKVKLGRLRKGDIIIVRNLMKPGSVKVKVVDIKEYTPQLREELRAVYSEKRLKAILNNRRVKKFYVIYISRINTNKGQSILLNQTSSVHRNPAGAGI